MCTLHLPGFVCLQSISGSVGVHVVFARVCVFVVYFGERGCGVHIAFARVCVFAVYFGRDARCRSIMWFDCFKSIEIVCFW